MSDAFTSLVALYPSNSVRNDLIGVPGRGSKGGLYFDKRRSPTYGGLAKNPQGKIIDATVEHLWRLDSIPGGIAPDAVGNLVPLTFSDPTPSIVSGEIDGALDFDDAQVLYAETNSLKTFFEGPFTIEAWVKPRGSFDEGTGNIVSYLASGANDDGQLHWLFNFAFSFGDAPPGQCYAYIYYELNDDASLWVDVDWNTTYFDLDVWAHIALRKTVRADGKVNWDLFKNGVRLVPCSPYDQDGPTGENPDIPRGLAQVVDPNPLVDYTLVVGGAYTNQSPSIPAGYPFGPDGPLDGMIDDVAFVNVARTDRLILDSYLKGL